jgi:hypothetical protein
MEIAGLPLHPLVVHAAVVLTPMAVLLAVVYAVWPRHRWLTRWPAVVLSLGALGAVYVARLSGEALLDARPELETLVEVHQERSELLWWLMLVLTGLVLVAAWALGGPSSLVSGVGARETPVALLGTLLPVALVAVGVAVLVSVALTGDAGARAVWS